MKIALAQIEVIPCRPDLNYENMVIAIAAAAMNDADMIIFPELCIPGYLIGDTWEETAFLQDCLYYGNKIKEFAIDIIIVFGNIAIEKNHTNNDGRIKKYNTLYCAENGEFRQFPTRRSYYIKTLLPNYREFDEPRHFVGSKDADSHFFPDEYFMPIDIFGISIGFCICEDGWDKDYSLKVIKTYVKNKANLIINISGSPFTIGKNNSRNKIFGNGHAATLNVPLIYVNAVGIQNNCKNIYTFDGSSVAYNKMGKIVVHAPMFKDCLTYVYHNNDDLQEGKQAILPATEIEEIEQAILYGTKKFLDTFKINKVVIGLSGGIDSAVSAIIYAKIVGPKNLLLVNMPSQYNSNTTINIAKKIADNIGCFYTSIGIEDSVKLTKSQIHNLVVKNIAGETQQLQLTDFHLENVQARDRSSRILAAVASAFGGVFPCNGNKAEISVGYCTFYGDMAGFLANLGDLWKEQIYALGRHLNKDFLLPEEVFAIPASAELSDKQNVDEGKGDPLIYWYHDRLFQSWMQHWIRCTPEENLVWYIDGTINEQLSIPINKDVYKIFPTCKSFIDDLEYWYKLFKGLAIAKRTQSPPILTVSRRAYGFDYRETLGNAYFTNHYKELKRSYYE